MTMILLALAVSLILLPSIRSKQAKIKANRVADGD